MIPLIDISLVLLIFFMMTMTVASISHINVPSMENAVKIDTSRDTVRIDVDLSNGKTVYAIGKGTAAAKDEDANLQNDTLNCGACGRACATGVPCASGACQGCQTRQTRCPAGCTDLQADPYNCGVCGNQCVSRNCSNGICF